MHSLKVETEGKKHHVAAKLVSYALTRSLRHARYQCGQGSLSPIPVYTVTGRSQYCDQLDPHLKDLCDDALSGQLACACA